ncbi:MAG: VCBS repeat-containing protein [Acidobacteria bacterium]|nr:VCBS repeat-containing protein [Acidobacteriota bacterium]
MMSPNRVKAAIVAVFFFLALIVSLAETNIAPPVGAMGAGPPNGFSGAPGENDCRACHFDNDGLGQFTLGVPPVYFPGRTYQVTVTHTNADTTRKRWGFQMTSLNAAETGAGTFANTNNQTQNGTDSGRSYINHTNVGSFANQTGGATWSFNWTAPLTNVGPIGFYAAGNQANNDHNPDGDQILFANALSRPQARFVDFDGDGKTDLSISRAVGAERQFWWLKSADQTVSAGPFGLATDTIAPADFTGDGKVDIAVFRPSSGQWFVLRSSDFSYYSINFGADGDVPAAADYDGDGKADAAVYRASTGTWFISRSGDNGVTIRNFGSPVDKPAVADFDGDGKADISIWKPDLGQWWRIDSATDTAIAFQFGNVGDKPVPGDYTGDGRADVAIFRPSNGTWYVLRSEDFSFYSFPFGIATDVAAPGDFDGDGTFDAAIFRDGTWFVNQSTAGTLIRGFGSAGDQPLPAAFLP